MRVMMTGRHVEVTPALRRYVEGRMSRLDRFQVKISAAQVILSVEKYRHKAEIVLRMDRTVLQSQALTDEMYRSIDRLFDKVSAQIRKRKEKRVRRTGATDRRSLRAMPLDGAPVTPSIKTIRRTLETLTIAEALSRLADQPAASFVFLNPETDRVQILQRDPRGRVELVDPLPSSARTA